MPVFVLCLVLGLAPFWVGSASGAESSISYAYSFSLSSGSGSYLQDVSASSATGTACTSAEDCAAKCPTTDFTSDGNASVESIQGQLYDCANAFRTSPETFADAINAVCSFSAFQNAITTPRRSALAASQQLSDLAEAHTNDMAANNSFNHISSSGQSPADRVRAVFPNTNAVGEVIAAGYNSVQAVLVNLICSDSHRAIITSCDYDTAGWGVEFNNLVNGQQVQATYNTYFTGNFLCSSTEGCSCSSSPPPASSSPSPPPTSVVSPPAPEQTPPGQTAAVAITFDVIFNQIFAGSLNAAQVASVVQDLSDALSSYVSPATADISINGTSTTTSQNGSPPPTTVQSTSPPPQSPSPTPPPQPPSPTPPPVPQSTPSGGNQGNNPPGFPPPPINYNPPSPTGFPPPPINYNPPSPTGFPPPPINYNPPSPNSGRRLQQSENTLQATVTFVATTSASPSADSSSLISDLTADITAYNAPVSVTVVATPVTSGSSLSLQVSVQFPPNNQVSTTPSYTTQLAATFGSAAANQTGTVFANYIAKDGSLSISSVQTSVVPQSAPAGTNLSPPSPIPVIGSGGSSGASSPPPSSTPTNPAQSPPPAPTSTESPPPSPTSTESPPPSPTSTESPPPSPTSTESPPPSPTSTESPPPSPTSMESPPPSPTSTESPPPSPTSTESPPPSPTFTESPPPSPTSTESPPPSPTLTESPPQQTPPGQSPPPAPAPPPPTQDPLVLEATITLAASDAALAQNLTQTLRNNPQAALYPLIARDGNITVTNVQVSQGSSAGIESASPLESPSTPTSIPSGAPEPAEANTDFACSMFALNMQFSTGRAATDQSTATLLAVFSGTPSGPSASEFTVLLSDGSTGSVEAVVPYSTSLYLLRITTPEGYYGSVTVSYSTSQLEPLQYFVVPSLVVKVTATTLTSVSR